MTAQPEQSQFHPANHGFLAYVSQSAKQDLLAMTLISLVGGIFTVIVSIICTVIVSVLLPNVVPTFTNWHVMAICVPCAIAGAIGVPLVIEYIAYKNSK